MNIARPVLALKVRKQHAVSGLRRTGRCMQQSPISIRGYRLS